MKRILFIMGAILLLHSLVVNKPQFGVWFKHFWGINAADIQRQGEINRQTPYLLQFYQVTNNQKTSVYRDKDPSNGSDESRIKYKLQKKPFFDPHSPIQFEFVLR